jgi:thioredoxin-like negative regulator of GroEL
MAAQRRTPDRVSAAVRALQKKLTALDALATDGRTRTRNHAIKQADISRSTGHGWFHEDDPKVPSSADELWRLVTVYYGWLGWTREAQNRERKGWVSLWDKAHRAPRSVAPRIPKSLEPLLRKQVSEGERLPYRSWEGRLRRLTEVHVTQTLHEQRRHDDTEGQARAEAECRPTTPPGRTEAESTASAHATIREVLAQDDGNVLVTAGPGGGKSVLAARLAADLSQQLLDATGNALHGYPYMVSARELDSDPDILDRAFSQLAGHTRWLLIVDAVDEIPDPAARRAIALRLGSLTREQAASGHQVRVVVTTRPLSGEESRLLLDEGYTPFRLEPFDRKGLRDFAERWFTGTAEPTADTYLHQVARAGLSELVGVPLLATITATLLEVAPERPLPTNRFVLYEYYRSYLATAKAQESEHSIKRMMATLRPMPAVHRALTRLYEDTEDFLAVLAEEWLAGTAVDLVDAALGRLGEEVGGLPEFARGAWREHAQALLTRTGLLVRGEDGLHFLHTSFAEHLAAGRRAGRLPAFAPNSVEWDILLRRARDYQRPALDTLVHRCYEHPDESRALLDLLQSGFRKWQMVADRLLAEGVPADDRHYETFAAGLSREGAGRTCLVQHPAVTQVLLKLAEAGGSRALNAASCLANQRHLRAADLLADCLVTAVDDQRRVSSARGGISTPRDWHIDHLITTLIDDLGVPDAVAQVMRPQVTDEAVDTGWRLNAAEVMARAGYADEAAELLIGYVETHDLSNDDCWRVGKFVAEHGYSERYAAIWRRILFEPGPGGRFMEAARHWAALGHRDEAVSQLLRIARATTNTLSDFDRHRAMECLVALGASAEVVPLLRAEFVSTDWLSVDKIAGMLCDLGHGEELLDLMRASARARTVRIHVIHFLVKHGHRDEAVACLRDTVTRPSFLEPRYGPSRRWWNPSGRDLPPDDDRTHAAQLFIECGLPDEATEVLRGVLRCEHSSPDVQGYAAVLLYKLGDPGAAAAALLRLLQLPKISAMDRFQAVMALAAWRIPSTHDTVCDNAVALFSTPGFRPYGELIDILLSLGRTSEAATSPSTGCASTSTTVPVPSRQW